MQKLPPTLTLVIFALAPLLLAGCAANLGTTTGSTARMFDLSPRRTAAAVPVAVSGAQQHNVQMAVYEPTAVRTLDGDRVMVHLASSEISYLDGAQWGDRLPVLVQNKLIEELQTSGLFRAVSNGRDKVDPDVAVSTSIQSFQIEVGPTASRAHVTLQVKLIEARSGSVIASRVFDASQPVAGKATANHVAALNAAFAVVSSEILTWISSAELAARKGRVLSASSRKKPSVRRPAPAI